MHKMEQRRQVSMRYRATENKRVSVLAIDVHREGAKFNAVIHGVDL